MMNDYLYAVKRFYFFFLLLFSNLFCSAQLTFTPADSIQVTINSEVLNNPWVGGINYPIWSNIDLNGDGILDLFCYDMTNERMSTYLNDGTQSDHPFHYAPQYISRFPKPPYSSWAKCADYNCDGKMDFFTLDSSRGGVALWRNDYTIATGLVFTKVSGQLLQTTLSNPNSPFPIFASAILIPSFIDMDNDGDLDILGFNSTPDGHLAYHRNMSKEDYGNCDSLKFLFETKCWGNFKLCLGSNKICTFGEVCSPPVQSDFNAPSHRPDDFSPPDDTVTTLFVFDVDGDGLKDALIGDLASTNSLLVHNAGTFHMANVDTQDTAFPSYDTPINLPEFVFHAYIDLNNDGKRDLLASPGFLENKHGGWFYENSGADSLPVFSLLKTNFMQEEMIDEGDAAAPVFFDYDNDGLLDMVIGHAEFHYPNDSSRLSLYKNTGTATHPAFDLVTTDLAALSNFNLQTPIYPAFGDMDGDGDYDLIIGELTGKLYYFNNTAGAGNIPNYQFVTSNYMGIDVGNASAPQIIDLDGDGKLDLLIGEQNGTLNFCKNTGTAAAPFFNATPTIDTLGFINVQHNSLSGFSVPYVFNNHSHYDMLVGSMNGDIFHYTNIDGNLNGAFTSVDTLITDSLGVRTNGLNLTISGADINADGKTDFAVGLFSGGVKIYYGNEPLVGIQEVSAGPQLFEVFPNPVSDNITVRLMERIHITDSKLILYNAVGEKVMERKMPGTQASFNVSRLAEGTYFLQLVSGSSSQYRKVVISHKL
jgi:hypothetical protein